MGKIYFHNMPFHSKKKKYINSAKRLNAYNCLNFINLFKLRILDIVLSERFVAGIVFLIINIIYLFTLPSACMAEPGIFDSVTSLDLEKQGYHLSIKDGLVSLDSRGANLRTILEGISNKTGIQIKYSGQIEHTITISVIELPIDEAISKISENFGMVFSKRKGKKGYQLVQVVIPESLKGQKFNSQIRSSNDTASIPKHQNLIKLPTSSDRSGSPNDTPASIPLINKEAELKTQTVPNQLIVRL